tara:strand:+ start:643 stop:885 length:243 start_codon:yes stop_codon:yes gene_type:complete
MIISIGIPLLIISFFSLNELPSFLNYKPFNCNICLSFWLVIILNTIVYFLPQLKDVVLILSYGGLSAYIAAIAKRVLFKI